MSYHLNLYPTEFKAFTQAGGDWEDPQVDAMLLPTKLLAMLRQRLDKLGYQTQSSPDDLLKMFGTLPVTVHIYPQMIAFSAPYWEGLNDALFDWRMEVMELTDMGGLHLFDPQANEWDFGMEE